MSINVNMNLGKNKASIDKTKDTFNNVHTLYWKKTLLRVINKEKKKGFINMKKTELDIFVSFLSGAFNSLCFSHSVFLVN